MKTTILVNYPGDGILKMVVETGDKESPAILEDVFDWCNRASGKTRPEFDKWNARDLSVNDFVSINGFWFQCKSFGWEPCCARYVDEIERKVVEHPHYAEHGGWVALDYVMAIVRAERS